MIKLKFSKEECAVILSLISQINVKPFEKDAQKMFSLIRGIHAKLSPIVLKKDKEEEEK